MMRMPTHAGSPWYREEKSGVGSIAGKHRAIPGRKDRYLREGN